MMFTAGGQPDLHVVMRGGGGKGGGGGGGGGSLIPPAASYVDPVNGMVFTDSGNNFGGDGSVTSLGPSGAQQLNDEIRQRQAGEKATSDAAAAQKTADAATAETTFQGRRQTAYDQALQAVNRQFQLQGLDPNAYMASDIQPTLQRQFDSIQDLDPNPGAAFQPTTLATDILNNVTSGRRTQVSNQLNNQFDPNYATNLLPDSTLDQFVPSIVSQQFDPLSSQLTNAQKRGTLTDTGYNAALAALNQKRTAATSQVSDLGRTILGTDRSGINDLITGAKNTAAGLSLNQTFDPSSYDTQAKGLASSDLSNFGGALTNAVGGTQYASLSDLLNAGGAVQGASNPSAINPTGTPGATSPFAQDPNVLANQKRGLGNQGAF
jgi:hypothetical protein